MGTLKVPLRTNGGEPRLPVAAAEPLARGSASSGLMDGSREAGGESSECLLNGNAITHGTYGMSTQAAILAYSHRITLTHITLL
jgi:hypothetical protein